MKKVSRLLALILALILSMQVLTFAATSYIDDDYPAVYDLYWNNKTAKWYVDGRANKYEVRLYRDGRRVSTKTVNGRSHNFSSEMARGDHDYYFEVRPYNSITGWGDWEQSDVKFVGHYSGSSSTYPSTGPGELSPSSSYTTTAQIVYNPVGQWQAINNYWHFVYSNGVMASNTWLQIGNSWYYVDVNTNMVVGLVNINGSTYYFNPDGTMVTGGIVINGMNHYFDASGKMVY